jgi:glucose-1-phosphate adenylyltransferase
MKDVIGLINDTTGNENLKELLKHRSVAAIPFGGRYRLIDFPLSNMVNSGIKNVGLFTHLKSRSLLEHLGTGKDWNLGTKKDGLFILPPAFEQGEIFEKFGDVDYFNKHRDYIEVSDQKYVIVSNSNCIYNLDFNLIRKFYFDSYADIVLVYKKGNDFQSKNQTILEIDNSSQRVIDIAVNPYKGGENIYCNIFFMRK